MTSMSATPSWDDVSRLELTTPAEGGPLGAMTAQTQAVLNRVQFLRSASDSFASLLGTNGSAVEARSRLGLPDATANYTNRGSWSTGTAYAVNDLVVRSSVAYQCMVAHTAGTFNTDEAAGRWAVYQGLRVADLSSAAGAALVGVSGGRTLQAVLDDAVGVVAKGADPTGAASSLAAFQAAIDATPNAGLQVIHVQRGTYAGDMSQLNLGARTVVWAEEAGVSYSTQFPPCTRSAVRSLPPLLFESSIRPERHLRAFGSRRAGSGAGAVATATVSGGAVTALAVARGGTGYSIASTRVLISGDGSGAEATPVISGGVITGFTVTAGGTGYTVASVYVVDGPVVVLVGDSISTEDPTPSIPNANLWACLQDSIATANPLRNVAFFNRAIGAQTFTSLNGVANSNWPSWYVNQSRAWIDYIADLKPDLIVVAMGMNDRENFVFAQFKAAMVDLRAIATNPDVVLATTMVPSAISSNDSISSAAAQIGRDATAEYVRGTALRDGLGLLDFNRQSRLVRDGVDVRRSAMRQIPIAGTPSLPWTAPVLCAGFYLDAVFDVSGSWWSGRTLTVDLGYTGVNSKTILMVDDQGGYLRVRVRDIAVGVGTFTDQFSYITPTPTPTSGSWVLGVSMRDCRLQVFSDQQQLHSAIIANYGGMHAPTLAGDTATATIAFFAGERIQFPSRLTDHEMWGYGDSQYHGNGLNHPTTLCVQHVIAPVIAGANWAASPLSVGSANGSTTSNLGVNEPNPRAHMHVTKTPVAAGTYNPASNANNLVLEDDTNPGLTLLSGAGGVARLVAGDSSNQSQFVAAYNHTNDSWSETINGVMLRQLFSNVDVHFVPPRLPSYTLSTLPTGVGAGAMAYCTNATGGAKLVIFDSVNWRKTDGTVVT